MTQRTQGLIGLGKPVGRLPLLLLICSMLLSCERDRTPQIPPDKSPKPQTGLIEQHSGIRSAVYSYVGHPSPLYRPETPIPVRRTPVHT